MSPSHSDSVKNFFGDLEAALEFDWDGLLRQAPEIALLAVKQAVLALRGAEERVLHTRMRIIRVVRLMELWKRDVDPEYDQFFASLERWIEVTWADGPRYAKKAWQIEEELAEIPMKTLTGITGANLGVLRETSSNVRVKPEVLRAAREMTQEQLKAHLTSNEGQHFEPIHLVPKHNADELEAVIELVMLAEDYTRPQAIETICDLVKSEYAVKAEHRKERTA